MGIQLVGIQGSQLLMWDSTSEKTLRHLGSHYIIQKTASASPIWLRNFLNRWRVDFQIDNLVVVSAVKYLPCSAFLFWKKRKKKKLLAQYCLLIATSVSLFFLFCSTICLLWHGRLDDVPFRVALCLAQSCRELSCFFYAIPSLLIWKGEALVREMIHNRVAGYIQVCYRISSAYNRTFLLEPCHQVEDLMETSSGKKMFISDQ